MSNAFSGKVGAGPTTSCLTATQDSETATDATWSDGRAAQDGSGTVPTLSGDLQAAEICVRARQWSNASEYRFNSRPERVKAWLTDPKGPILRLPNFEKPFYLLCDAASTVGCSAVLVQKDKNNHEHPVAYYSKRWTEAESRRHSLEHECATIYEGIKRFAHYLHDKFYVMTDAEPLWLGCVR